MRRQWLLAGLLLLGCAGVEAQTIDQDKPQGVSDSVGECAEDCVQPPLLRSDLLPFLLLEQPRILAREDYKRDRPPLISKVAYGEPPEHPLREGDLIRNEEGMAYEGELNWHRIPFEAFKTEEVRDRRFRKRTASGSHCFFARQPNTKSPLFTIVAVHHRDRGDQLYFSGFRQETTRIDTVPITDEKRGPLRVGRELYCVFRDDESLVGAVVVPVVDREGEKNAVLGYALYRVQISDVLRPTGEVVEIHRAAQRGGANESEIVDVLRHPHPVVEWIGLYEEAYQAFRAAEEVIPSGRFRLRREFIYPRMPYQAYLGGEEEQFCPRHTRCERPPQQLDVNLRPQIPRDVIEAMEAEASKQMEEEETEGLKDVQGSGPEQEQELPKELEE